MRQTVKRGEKAMQKSILTELSIKIDNSIQKNGNNRNPHGFVHNLVNETVVLCPWIIYDKMMNFHRAHAKRGSNILAVSLLLDTFDGNATASIIITGTTNTNNAAVTDDYTQLRNKAGRPVGSTKKRERADDIAIIASTNEIVVKYKTEIDKATKIAQQTKMM